MACDILPPLFYTCLKKMNIVFVGSGNVASHLAKVFAAEGHHVAQIWSRDIRHACEAASAVGASATDRLDGIDLHADIYIIAVPDDRIGEGSGLMPEVEGVVLHTSGSVAMDTLKQDRCGVIWFPHTFIKGAEMKYDNLNCCYEGSSAEVVEKIEMLLEGGVAKSYKIDSEQRRWAHLASVVTNNFSHALNTLGERIMEQHGLDFAMLWPIIMETAERVKTPRLEERQTGPAARHDEKTLAAHKQMLSDNKEALKVYEVMSDLIQKFQKSSGSR